MIKLFKSNIPAVYAFVILFVTVACAEVIWTSNIEKYHFYNWYVSFLLQVKTSTLLDYLLTFGLILLTGYFINRTINKTSFFTKKTALPLFIFVAFLSTWDGFYFETAYVTDLIFALIVLKLIELDQNKTAVHVAFITGLLLGVGFLFSYWVLPLSLVLFFALLTFRPFIGREWLVAMIGMGIPTLYLLSLRYLLLDDYAISPTVLSEAPSQRYWYDYLSYGLLLLVVLVSFGKLSRQLSSMSNIERKQLNILGLFTVITVILSLGALWIYKVEYFILTVPLTLMTSIAVLNSKRDTLLSALFIALMVVNLLRIFLFS